MMTGTAGSTCYLNGEFIPLADAKISVLDRGFIFGDAVYEVIPAFNGHILGGAEHIERLARSLEQVSIANPCERDEWFGLIERVVAENGGGSQSVYLQVTRGVAERDHAFPKVTPTVFIMSRPLPTSGSLMRVNAQVLIDNRWGRCDIKSTSLLPNVLLRNQAIACGAYEAILVREGFVTEGTASNVFVVIAGEVRTPPLSNLILPGVTRALLIDTLRRIDIHVAECAISEDELRRGDEIWLASSMRDVICVGSLDGQARPSSTPLAERAYSAFQKRKKQS